MRTDLTILNSTRLHRPQTSGQTRLSVRSPCRCQSAMDSGVARIAIDLEAYKAHLEERLVNKSR